MGSREENRLAKVCFHEQVLDFAMLNFHFSKSVLSYAFVKDLGRCW